MPFRCEILGAGGKHLAADYVYDFSHIEAYYRHMTCKYSFHAYDAFCYGYLSTPCAASGLLCNPEWQPYIPPETNGRGKLFQLNWKALYESICKGVNNALPPYST
jgi:hypothetical protein